MYYKFVRIHQTLKVTPAMAAGFTDRLPEIDDIIRLLEDWQARQAAESRPNGKHERSALPLHPCCNLVGGSLNREHSTTLQTNPLKY
jgi:hypothetical protein